MLLINTYVQKDGLSLEEFPGSGRQYHYSPMMPINLSRRQFKLLYNLIPYDDDMESFETSKEVDGDLPPKRNILCISNKGIKPDRFEFSSCSVEILLDLLGLLFQHLILDPNSHSDCPTATSLTDQDYRHIQSRLFETLNVNQFDFLSSRLTEKLMMHSRNLWAVLSSDGNLNDLKPLGQHISETCGQAQAVSSCCCSDTLLDWCHDLTRRALFLFPVEARFEFWRASCLGIGRLEIEDEFPLLIKD
ncbi:unnamed protein product [Protopolystoma xenopodis]|uniref:Uncharacterized protein n=1 Tax=Protopolystoma xenopodis TaxID=117903 RepID=A0A448WFX4_9PLAT|nr:unnamed protein product [Protopolystoma xenopodis]